MKVSESMTPMAAWGKSHRIVLLAILALVICLVLVGWFYLSSSRQVSKATVNDAQQSTPVVPVPSSPIQANPASNVDVQAVIQNDGTRPPKTHVLVNGQQIHTPETGTVKKVIQTPEGTTTVDVSVDNNTAGTTSSHTSTTVNLNSSSETNITSEGGQQVP
jgi:hypothetical protein